MLVDKLAPSPIETIRGVVVLDVTAASINQIRSVGRSAQQQRRITTTEEVDQRVEGEVGVVVRLMPLLVTSTGELNAAA